MRTRTHMTDDERRVLDEITSVVAEWFETYRVGALAGKASLRITMTPGGITYEEKASRSRLSLASLDNEMKAWRAAGCPAPEQEKAK